MSPLLLLSLAFLLSAATPCLGNHVININSSAPLRFSSLAWNPTALHFVVGSSVDPTIYVISDNGTVKCLLPEPHLNSSGVSVNAIAMDSIRQRMIVAFSNPSSVAAYDSISYRKIYAVTLPELDGAPGGVTVDSETGEVFVSSGTKGAVLKVGLEGDRKKVISGFEVSGGLGGIMYLGHGSILTVEPITGKIFKVDTVDGSVKEVLVRDKSQPLAQSSLCIARQTEEIAAVATNHSIFTIKTYDAWAQAALYDLTVKLREGDTVVAVAMQEGHWGDVAGADSTLYVLVKSKMGYRIEEAAWEEPFKPYMVVLMVLLLVFMCIAFRPRCERTTDDEPKKALDNAYGHETHDETLNIGKKAVVASEIKMIVS